MEMLLACGVFALSAAVIVFAGTKLTRHGNRIADETGLGGLWIGVVLMASATSLPEILTGMSAAWMNEPDLAAGGLIGSNMANMLILGIIDLLHRQKRLWQQAAVEHALGAGIAIFLTGLAAFFVLYDRDVKFGVVGLGSSLLLLLYVLGMRLVFRQENLKRREREQEKVIEGRDADDPKRAGSRGALRRAGIGFGVSTLALLIASPLVAGSARTIAEHSGISATFIGASLIGITTSLPELVTAIAAVRLGAFDLAVGNLFGSNAFNMAAFFFVDLAFGHASVFSAASQANAMAALWSILLMSLALMGIIYRAEKRYLLVEPDSLLVVLGYCLGLWLLFQ